MRTFRNCVHIIFACIKSKRQTNYDSLVESQAKQTVLKITSKIEKIISSANTEKKTRSVSAARDLCNQNSIGCYCIRNSSELMLRYILLSINGTGREASL